MLCNVIKLLFFVLKCGQCSWLRNWPILIFPDFMGGMIFISPKEPPNPMLGNTTYLLEAGASPLYAFQAPIMPAQQLLGLWIVLCFFTDLLDY